MQTLWFILVAFMLTMYVVLDGFDLGAGVMHLFAARDDLERRTILRAIGPVWDGNEVWLIAAGGTMFFTFPVLYASSFSGFYLPLIMVLWFLMLRGVAVELRSHLQNPVWIAFWDGLFFLGSTLLALFYGVALGNVIRGVPLNSTGTFFMPLWTDFNPYGLNPGILDWYTILIGLLALAALTAHGANYLAVKTEGRLNTRSRRIARLAWLSTMVLTVLGIPVCPGGGVSLVEHWHGPRHPLLSPHLPSVLGQGAPDGDDRLLTRYGNCSAKVLRVHAGASQKKRHTCTCEGILCKQNLDKFFVIAYKDYIDDVVSIAVVETCTKWEVDM